MSKWIAEFDLEDGDTMPEHMDLNYMGAKIDFYCRPMWIPCSERLPEDGQSVLFCDIDNDIMVGYHVKGRPNTHFTQNGTFEDMKNVRAWTPLPEPYKAESEDDMELKLDKRVIDEAVQKAVKDIKQNYIPKDVLDKIRAEIEKDWQLNKYPSSPFSCGLRRAIEIIDKYKDKAESEKLYE